MLGLLCSQEWRCDLGHLSLRCLLHIFKMGWAHSSIYKVCFHLDRRIWVSCQPRHPQALPPGLGEAPGQDIDKDHLPRLGDPALLLRLSAAPAGRGGPLTSGNDVPRVCPGSLSCSRALKLSHLLHFGGASVSWAAGGRADLVPSDVTWPGVPGIGVPPFLNQELQPLSSPCPNLLQGSFPRVSMGPLADNVAWAALEVVGTFLSERHSCVQFRSPSSVGRMPDLSAPVPGRWVGSAGPES